MKFPTAVILIDTMILWLQVLYIFIKNKFHLLMRRLSLSLKDKGNRCNRQYCFFFFDKKVRLWIMRISRVESADIFLQMPKEAIKLATYDNSSEKTTY